MSDQTGLLENIDEAIDLYQQAIRETPSSHNAQAILLCGLTICLDYRYGKTMELGDLEESIRYTQKTLEYDEMTIDFQAAILGNLSEMPTERYQLRGACRDLDDATRNGQESIRRLGRNPWRAEILADLGSQFHSKYLRTQSIEDLEEAICYKQEAFEISPDGGPDRINILMSLNSWLKGSYEMTKQSEKLEASIWIGEEAIRTVNYNRDRLFLLREVSDSFSRKFLRTKDSMALDKAIALHEQVAEAASYDDQDRAQIIAERDCLLTSRNPSLETIEEVVKSLREAIETIPFDHPQRPNMLLQLCRMLAGKYTFILIGESRQAMFHTKLGAIEMTPHDLLSQADDSGTEPSLRFSSDAMRKAFKIMWTTHKRTAWPFHPEIPITLYGTPGPAQLLSVLKTYSGLSGYTEVELLQSFDLDLHEAIDVFQKRPDQHSPADRFKNLTDHRRLQLGHSNEASLEVLHGAIQAGREAEAVNQDHGSLRHAISLLLGSLLIKRYNRTGTIEDLEEAKAQHVTVAMANDFPPYDRMWVKEQIG
ncbi:hypothetical protein AOQ84DRAFT_424707 [Glonium stellatum]|uniref:Uncharacterized protein n=1 Tax=Glonium stellatum TaxID=574774 RepID=A0A8E2F6G6_9PEZI|nr:hypothetical protein AOQ84DRAFT_424707 [Glonium stellatum]